MTVCWGEAAARSTQHRAAQEGEGCQLKVPGHTPGRGMLKASWCLLFLLADSKPLILSIGRTGKSGAFSEDDKD